MKKIIAILSASVLSLSLMACGESAGSVDMSVTETAGIETATKSEDGLWYTVDGSTLTVSLEGNPTTGYEWTGTVDNPGVLTISEPEYKSFAAADEITCGGGGIYEFVVTPITPGAAQVRFSYARGWEDGVEPIESKLLSVGVAEDGTLHVMEIDTTTTAAQ